VTVSGARRNGNGLGAAPSIYDVVAKRYGGSRRAPTNGTKRKGASTSGGAGDGDLASALDSITARRKATEALGGNDKSLFESTVGELGGGLKKALSFALDAADTPRAAILSFGAELGDLVDRDGDHQFNLGTAIKNTRDNYSFGEFLHDDVSQSESWNPIVKGAASFAADVAMDPLTYLSAGATSVEGGAKGAAGALLKATDEDLLKAGLTRGGAEAAAADVLKARSASVLDDAARQVALNGERGIYWNAPGTGRVGRRLKIDKAIDAVTGGRYGLSEGERTLTKQVRLGGGKRLSKVNELIVKGATSPLRTASAAKATVWGMNGGDALAKVMLRSGDPTQAKRAFFTIEDSARGRLQRKKFATVFGGRAEAVALDAKAKGVNMKDLWLAAADDQPAIARIIAKTGDDGFVVRTRALFDDMMVEANRLAVEAGGTPFIKGQSDYTARILTDESRDAMKVSGGRGGRGSVASIDGKRKFGVEEGMTDSFLGHKLHAVKDTANNPEGLSIESQISRIFQSEMAGRVPNKGGLFIEDATKAFPMYAQILAKRVGDEYTAGLLKARGFGVDAFVPTLKSKARVAASARAVRGAEQARRLQRMAKAGVAATTDALGLGEAKAARTGAEAATATKGARRAAQEAAGAVGTEVSKGAEAMREFADLHTGLADDMSRTLAAYVNDATPPLERTSTEIAAMRLKGERLRTEQGEFSKRLRALTETRRDLYEEMSSAVEAVEARMGTAAHLDRVNGEIEALTQKIADTNDMLDDMVRGIKESARPPEVVKAELDALINKQRSLAGKIPSLSKKAAAGDVDAARELAALRTELATDSHYRSALRMETRTGKRVDGEMAELVSMGKSEVQGFRERIQRQMQVAEELGRDEDAVRLGALMQSVPAWDESTQRMLSPRTGEAVWYHGTPKSGIDLTRNVDPLKGTIQQTDSMAGFHVTDNEDYAATYSTLSARGEEALPGEGGVANLEVAINPEEMMVYPKGGFDLEWAAVDHNEPLSRLRYGTVAGQAKVEMLDDMMSTALRADDIEFGVDELHDGLTRMFNGVDLEDEDIDFLYQAAEQVKDLVDDGLGYSEALTEVFSYSDYDILSWHGLRSQWADEAGEARQVGDNIMSGRKFDLGQAQGAPYPQGVPQFAEDFGDDLIRHDERVGNAMMFELEWNIDPAARQRVADGFREKHSQYRGAFYAHGGSGGQEAMIFDRDAIRAVGGGTGVTVKDAAGLRDEIHNTITKASRAATDAAREADNMIGDIRLGLEDVAKRANDNDQIIRTLESRLGNQRAQVSAKTRDLYGQEMAYRTKAQSLYRDADRIQQEFVEAQMLAASTLGEEAGRLAMEEQRIVVQNQRMVAVLEAQHNEALAQLTRKDKSLGRWENLEKRLSGAEIEIGLNSAIEDGMKQFGSNTYLPGDMVDSLSAATRLHEPGGLRKVLGAFDYMQNLWKGYATMTPGFLFRNALGGVWNNYLADVDRGVYQHWFTAMRREGKGTGIWDEAYSAATKAGIHTGGQSVGEVAARHGAHLEGESALKALGRSAKMKGRFNPLRPEFAPVAGVRLGSEHVENMLRGSLFMDVYVKTEGDVGAAVAAVNKYHFDYDDLSGLERSVARRIVPFYTWTRKNLPLQLEMIARKPQKFNRFTQAKAEVENMSEAEGIKPGYFGENMAVRLPWTREGGNVYYFPDLPFTGLSDFADPGATMGMVSPFIRTPMEMWAGKQVWNDIPLTDKPVGVSPLIQAVPMLMPALEQVGWAWKGPEGDWQMKDRHMYALTNWLPTFGHARRLAPAESKYQQRHVTSMLSFMGAGLRTNTTTDKNNVYWGEYYKLKDALATAEQRGFLDKAITQKSWYTEHDPGAPIEDPSSISDGLLKDYVLPGKA